MTWRSNQRTWAVISIILMAVVSPSAAKVIYVDDDGAADFNNIQAAINDANDGDIIEVHPGLYRAEINFLGKNIILTSVNPTDSITVATTIIGGDDGNETIVLFRGTEEPNCMLTGFNINGIIAGVDWFFDPGSENHTRATISHCLLQSNCGACGTVITSCDGIISNCIISDNPSVRCPATCAAPIIDECHGLIKNCTIANNAYVIQIGTNGSTKIQNCIIYDSFIRICTGGSLNISHCNVHGGIDAIYMEDPTCALN